MKMETDHLNLDSDFDYFAFREEAKPSPDAPSKCDRI